MKWLLLIGLITGLAALGASSLWGVVAPTPPHVSRMPSVASERLSRISQNERAEYASAQEYATWSPSTCSTTSMTEVLNAYGAHLRITDVLAVEAGMQLISPALGMLTEAAIARTVSVFGFATIHRDDPPTTSALAPLQALGNAGYPVIVGFPPDRWPGGHLLVLLGGDSSMVRLADSSSFNLRSLPMQQFLVYWGGSSDLVTPTRITAPPRPASPATFAKSPWLTTAWNAALSYQLPSPLLFLAQIGQESSWHADAVSPAGAVGIAQLLPSTAACVAHVGTQGTCLSIDPSDPRQALPAAAFLMHEKWIAALADQGGNALAAYQEALARYNAGDGATASALARCALRYLTCLPTETQHYVAQILS